MAPDEHLETVARANYVVFGARLLIETFVGVFTALLTFLVIIFAEIIPKTVGELFSEAISLFVARPVTMLTHVFYPFLWAVERMTGSLHVEGRAGVSEEEISGAKADFEQLEKMEKFASDRKRAKRFARNGDLESHKIPYLPVPQE